MIFALVLLKSNLQRIFISVLRSFLKMLSVSFKSPKNNLVSCWAVLLSLNRFILHDKILLSKSKDFKVFHNSLYLSMHSFNLFSLFIFYFFNFFIYLFIFFNLFSINLFCIENRFVHLILICIVCIMLTLYRSVLSVLSVSNLAF